MIRLRYGLARAILLVLILLIPDVQPIANHEAERLSFLRAASASAAPKATNAANQPTLHQAVTPTASGAYPPYPLNHTFDAEPIDLGSPVPNHDFETPGYAVGSPPANDDFSDAPVDVGAQPANGDFASGTFSNWTLAGSPSIQTCGGPDAAWARLNASNQAIISDPFTVDPAAQELVFDIGYLTTSGFAGVSVYIAAGPSYAFSGSATKSFYCLACNRWDVGMVDLSPFLGQSIAVKFVYYLGVAGLDRVRQQAILPGYAATGPVERRTDASGSYAALTNSGASITTPVFTVDAAAQFGAVQLTGLTATNGQAYVKVLSGAGYATSTTVATEVSLAMGTWKTVRFNVSGWRGQSIKLKVDEAYGSVGADDLGTQRVDFPGWDVSGMATLVPGETGGFAAQGGIFTSSAFTVPADAQQTSLRYRVADGGAPGVQAELLTGPTYATSVNLSGGYLTGTVGQWNAFKAAINAYAGQSVKLRFTPVLQQPYIDDIGLMEKAVPGWTFTGFSGAVAAGQDANGTYLTPWSSTGRLELLSSTINLGVLQPASGNAQRSFVVSYELGFRSANVLYIDWIPDVGTSYRVYQDVASTPTGFKNGRFNVYNFMSQQGHFKVYLGNGGRVYSIGDNVARQQRAEPFSQQARLPANSSIDSSTGSFGTSETDLTISGGSTPFSLTRSYAGHSDRHGEFGYRWSNSFDAYAAVYNGGDVAVVFGSGQEEYFAWNSAYHYFSPADARITSTLTKLGSGDYQYVTKQRTIYNFTASGDLISIVDANGNALTLYRDPSTDLVTSIEDDAGRSISLSYDTNGFLTEATTSEGATVDYTYDGNGDLVAVDKLIAVGDPTARTEYVYSRHRLITIKQRQGDAVSNSMVTVLSTTLDDFNRVVAETDALGHDLTIAYQTPANGVTRVTDALGTVTDYYFDAWARTVNEILPSGAIVQWLYDGNGQLQSVIDPAGNGYQFAYNASGDPTQITDPLNQALQINWDAVTHLPTEVVNASGAYTVNTYDAVGNLLQTVVDASVDALGNPIPGTHLDLMTIATFDAAGRKTSVTVDPSFDAAGTPRAGNHLDLMTRYEYDAAGDQILKVVDPSTDANGDPRAGAHLDLATSWTYDNDGRLLSETDANYHTTTYEYDTLGRLQRIDNALDQHVDLLVNFQDQVLGVRDPAGGITTWTYDARGLVSSQADEEEFETAFAYDDNGREISATDPLGHATQTTYTEDGKVATVTDALGHETSYTYDAAGRVQTETDPLGRVTAYDYDESGRLVATTAPNGGGVASGYDADGRRISSTNALSKSTTYAYDAAGRLAQTTDALGRETHYAYDAASRLISVANDLGETTSYAYDAAGRIVAITDPLGHQTLKTYDDAGNPLSVTDPDGKTTSYEYDALDRLVATTDPLGRTSTTTYDAAGRTATRTTPEGRVTTFAYNPRGLLTSVTDNLGNVTSYAYDDAGRRTTETNPRGFATTYAYDAADRLVSMTDALNHTVSFGYDAAGQETSVTDARGKTTTYTYDDLGNELTETDPLGNESVNTYDLAGQLETANDARGVLSQYGYDDDGELTSILYPGGGIGYAYDDAGRQTQMTDPTGVTTWAYDAAGRTTSVADPTGTIAYGYDDAGHRTSMTLPGGRTATYGFDDAGQLSSTTDWLSQTTSYGYDLDGALTTVARPNGINSLYSYDDAGRLTTIEHGDASSLLQRYVYTLDADGNRTSVTTSGTAATAGVESYAFDALDRLTEVNYPGGGSAAYAYDAAGNRASVTSGTDVTNYTYDDAGQLTQIDGPIGTVALTYDANGNRLTAAGDSYTWTWDNQLESVDDGANLVSYAYAGDGARVARTENSTATAYLWDRASGLPQLVDDGAAGYLHGPDGVSEELSGAVVTSDLPDALGTVRGRADATGAITGTADYDAWGNLQASSGSPGSLGWTGELTDPTTGFTDLRARDYAPEIGQFLSRDTTIPNAPGTQGYNAYAYAAANPVTFTDPSGHEAIGLGGGFGFPLPALPVGGGAAGAGAAAWPWELIIPPLVEWLLSLPLIAFIAAAFLVLVIVFILIGMWLDSQHADTQFGSRAAGAAGGAGAAMDRIFHGAGAAAELPGRVKDKLDRVLGDVLGRTAVLVIIGAGIAVKATGGDLGGDGGDDKSEDSDSNPCGTADKFKELASLLVDIFGVMDAIAAGPSGSPGQRLPQDSRVKTGPPEANLGGSSVGQSPTQNRAVQNAIERLRIQGATDIRVNQQQVNAGGQRVGINRPDLQFTFDGQRYYVEFDTPASTRAGGHAARTQANDPEGIVICKTMS